MRNKKERTTWASLRKLMKPFLGSVAALVIMTIVQSLLQVGLAMMSQSVIDSALAGNDRFWFYGAILLGILLSLVAVYGLLSWYAGSAVDRSVAKMRMALMEAASRSDGARLQAYHSGELLSRGIEDARVVCDGMINVLPAFVGQVTRLMASFAAVLILYPPLTAPLILASVAVGAVAASMRPIMRRQHRKVREAETKVMSEMQEDLQQLELIQSIGAESQRLLRFDAQQENSLTAKRVRRYWTVGASGLIALLSQLGSGALLFWGAAQVASSGLSYGSLTAMIQLLALFRGPVLGISGLWTRLSGVEVSGERLLELLDEKESDAPASKQELKVSAVVFENVTFHYPGDEAPVVENFNIRFPVDGWACLTGISGRGKSTLFKLMLGLYTPQQGRVYLQTDQGDVPCSKQTRHLFAYVPQDYALFSGTIRENLLLVAPDAEEAQRREALKIAQAEFVWSLTDGENTQVRENNAGLSKGQLQRLAIARAVLMQRQIFLLDECTSALDHETEERVLQGLRESEKSAILVTHRPEALKSLDGIASITMEV